MLRVYTTIAIYNDRNILTYFIAVVALLCHSFNGEDLWLSRTRDKQVKVGTAEKLKRWQEWLARVREEGVPEVVVRQPR